MKKNSCTPINPKKIFMLWPKKKFMQGKNNEKKFLQLENSPPPSHNFSNGPSLRVCLNNRGFSTFLFKAQLMQCIELESIPR